MRLFYKAADKDLLEIRNKLFLNHGAPALINQGFNKSPFSSSWFGRNNLKDYTYEFCRVAAESRLEYIAVEISRGDRWIKIFLNIFELKPDLQACVQLNGRDGLQFMLPPNSITAMRLRMDDFKGMPLFQTTHHKIGSYYSKAGLNRSVHRLSALIEKDLNNIDYFVKRWHEMHTLKTTTWEGYSVDEDSATE